MLAPANNSGVLGFALVELDDRELTVEISAVGLTPDREHPQHIHGFDDQDGNRQDGQDGNGDDHQRSELPTIALDGDNDGFVEEPEAEEATGPVILALTEDGEITNEELGPDFPTANSRGELEFEQTYRFDLDDPDQREIFEQLQDKLEGRAVELHGLEVSEGQGEGSQHEVRGEGGYIEVLPVATGILREVPEDFDLDVQLDFDEIASLKASATDFLFGEG